MKQLLLSLLLILATSALGQNYKKVYRSTGTDIHAKVLSNDESKGIVIGGLNHFDALYYRVDTLGNIIWQKSFNFAEADVLYPVSIDEIISTPDSSFFLTGTYVNPFTINPELFVLKAASNGDVIWYQAFGDSTSITGTSATITSDSNYLIVSGFNESDKGFNICKMNPNGSVLWSTSYNTGTITQINAIDRVTDSSFVITGYLEPGSFQPQIGFLSEISDQGNIIWTKTYENWLFKDIKFDGERIIVCGVNENENHSAFVGFADTTGTIYLNKKMNGSGSYWESHKLTTLDDASVLYLGVRPFASSCLHIDTSGTILNYYRALLRSGDLMPTNNGGALLLGSGPLQGVKQLYDDEIATIRLDSNIQAYDCFEQLPIVDSIMTIPPSGTLALNSVPPLSTKNITLIESSTNLLTEDRCTDILSSLDEISQDVNVQTYPNPSNGTFSFEVNLLETVDIRVYASSGIVIYEEKDVLSATTIDLSDFADGAYYYKVTTRKGLINSGLLILQK